MRNSQKGFTLIELLVVIAIIGILASIVLVSLGSARSRAIDAKVQSQLSSMRPQAELFYSNGGNYGTVGDCSSGTLFTTAASSNGLAGLLGAIDPSTYSIACLAYAPSGGAASAWAVSVESPSGTSWCVDSQGQLKTSSSTIVIGTGAICP